MSFRCITTIHLKATTFLLGENVQRSMYINQFFPTKVQTSFVFVLSTFQGNLLLLLAIHLNLIVSLSRGQFPTHGWNKNLFYTNLIETCFFPTKIQKSYQPLQISVCIFIYFIFFILEVYCIPTGCYLFFSVNQLLYCYAGSNPNLIYISLPFFLV